MSRRPPRRWLATAEAAASIGVSRSWVRLRIEDGSLPALVVAAGGRKLYRIRDDDWRAFVARFTGEPDDPRFE